MQWLAVSQIKSSDVGRRLQAIEALGHSHEVKAILALIGALADPVPRVRVAALKAIGLLRDERCVQPLLAVLRDPEARVREAAVTSLKDIGHVSVVPYLVPLLCDAAANVRGCVAHSLKSLGWTPVSDADRIHYFIAIGQFSKAAAAGVAAIDPLLLALKDESSSKRRAVTEALTEIEDARAIAAVASMLDDPDSGVRLSALVALGRTRDEAFAPAVLKQLEHPDKNVRACALETLAKIGCTDLFPLLVNALKDEHWNVRAVAASTLGYTGDGRGVEPLIEALAEPDPDVRQVVAEAVGRLRDQRAIEPLILAQLDPDSRVRTAMSTALSQIHPDWPRSEAAQLTLAPLKQALKNGDYAVRQSAAELLDTIFNIRQCEPSLLADVNAETARRERAVDVLASVLWDDDPLLRFACVWTLHQIGDSRAVAPLSAKLKDSDECVRTAAERALAHFGIKEGSAATAGSRLVEEDDSWGMGPIA